MIHDVDQAAARARDAFVEADLALWPCVVRVSHNTRLIEISPDLNGPLGDLFRAIAALEAGASL